MSVRLGVPTTCDACGKQLIGAMTRAGKVAPVELLPDENGNVLLFRGTGSTRVLECRAFGGEAQKALLGQGVPLRLMHFATCGSASEFRRDKAA